MKSARQLAFDILLRVRRDGAWSNLALAQAVRREKADRTTASFAAALAYGVLERSITLDYVLTPYLKKGVASLDPEVRIILEMGLYQLCWMDSVPDAAAVDESVRLAGYARKTSAKGLVNAVLRRFLREGNLLRLPENPQTPVELSTAFSCPEWMLSLWSEQYGVSQARRIAEASLGRPPVTVRVNTLRTTEKELTEELKREGVSVQPHDWLADCLFLSGTGGVDSLPAFQKGLFHVQDASSQLCAAALGVQPGERILDCCAAPGSKSFMLAERMENRGEILACDLYGQRLRLVEEGAQRLGLSILSVIQRDATEPGPEEPASFDRVLCDVPCSGLGVLRRKPEIREKSPEEPEALLPIQYSILKNAARLVKPGGRLVYSTCTLNQQENEGVVSQFLKENSSFKPLQLSGIFDKIKGMDSLGTTLFPGDFGGDGFYIAVMECCQ